MQFKSLAITLFAAAAVAQDVSIDYAQLVALQAALAATCGSFAAQLSQLSGAYDSFSYSSKGAFIDDLNKQVGDFEGVGSDFVKRCWDISGAVANVGSYQVPGSDSGPKDDGAWAGY